MEQNQKLEFVPELKRDKTHHGPAETIRQLKPATLVKVRRVAKLLAEGNSPNQIMDITGFSSTSTYDYIKVIGDEIKDQLYDLSFLIAEQETHYYAQRKRIMNQINKIVDILKKKPRDVGLIKSLVKLEYVLNRIDTDRIGKLRMLRVVPMKGEAKFVHHSGGYKRVNYEVDIKHESERPVPEST